MDILAKFFIGLVAFEHLYICYMEMFAWETLGRKAFKGAIPNELFTPTKKMAGNQGLYNSFLAAGLIWSLLINDNEWALKIAYFFLTCVVVAAVYGAVTASKKILIVQGIPAIITILILLFAG